MIELENERRIETEVTHSQWPNYVKLKVNLVEDIDTGPDDERQASWQWNIEDQWIRLS